MTNPERPFTSFGKQTDRISRECIRVTESSVPGRKESIENGDKRHVLHDIALVASLLSVVVHQIIAGEQTIRTRVKAVRRHRERSSCV
jgi:hypothetical protein